VDAFGAELERSLHVVVHHERDAGTHTEISKRPPALDPLGSRHALEPELDERGSAVDRNPRGAEVVDEGVQDHVALARSSSVAGSSA
jgi:hypothetical protein